MLICVHLWLLISAVFLHPRSVKCRRDLLGREGFLRRFHDRGEGLWINDRHIGQDFAIRLDVRLLQAGDKLA